MGKWVEGPQVEPNGHGFPEKAVAAAETTIAAQCMTISENGASISYRLSQADILSAGTTMPDRMSGAPSVQNERAPLPMTQTASKHSYRAGAKS
jgi:hypothetical protein